MALKRPIGPSGTLVVLEHTSKILKHNPLGDRHVLMVSPIPLRKTLYFSGSFREHRFETQYQGRDFSPDKFAGKIAQKRR